MERGGAEGALAIDDYEPRQIRKEATVIIFLCARSYSQHRHF